MAFVYAWIVPLWADQLLLQLLMEQFDTLRIQCRHIEHMLDLDIHWFLKRIYLGSAEQGLKQYLPFLCCKNGKEKQVSLDHINIEHFHLAIFILICLLHGEALASELCIFFAVSI